MSTTAASRNSLSRLAWSGFAVLIAAFVLLFGGSSSASAAEDETPGTSGLLGLLSKTAAAVVTPVTETLTPVVDTVTPTVKAVTESIEDVAAPVTQVASAVVTKTADAARTLPVVGAHIAPKVDAIGTAVAGAGHGVTELLGNAPIAAVTDPLLDLVGAVPVVGAVVDDSGARDLVDTIVDIVDEGAADAGTVIDQILPPIADPADPSDPTEDAAPIEPVPAAPDEEAADAVAPALGTALLAQLDHPGAAASATPALPAATPATPIPTGSPPPASPGASSSSVLTGGGSSAHDPTAISAVGDGPPGASWRGAPADGDALPASPVSETDVSPG